MRPQRKNIAIPVVVVLTIVFCLAVGLRYYHREQRFSQLLPFHVEEIVRCEISTAATDNLKVVTFDLTEKDGRDLLECLEQGSYKRDKRGTSLQGCYCRLYLWTSDAEHVEIMFSEEQILVNDFGSKPSQIYLIEKNRSEISNCINGFINSATENDVISHS